MMELVTPPDSADVQDFQFKLQRKLPVFIDGTSIPKGPCNLLAAASYYGLVFIGSPSSTLLVYHLKDLVDRSVSKPLHRAISLPSCPEFVSLSCDQQLLAVTVNKNSAAVALIYNVKDFEKENLSVSREIRLSPTPGVSIRSLQWNPCLADTLAVCCSAGSLAVYQLKPGSLDAQNKPANAICLCWSPKGKQIVAGNRDGTLSQYKPDLTLVKEVKAPQIFPGVAQALAIHWVSNYQYAVVYRDPNDEDGRPNLTIINTPKGGTPNCINYDDICFSMGNQRPAFYYLWQIMNWNVILASSSNSMEVGVLGSKDGGNWQHWTQVDEARAELPLTDKKQESYPIGLAFDTAAIHQIPWGENELPPMPMVHLLSHSGLLVTFNVINLATGAVQICSPPLQLLKLPERLLTSDFPDQPAPVAQPQQEVLNPITSTPVVPKAQSIFSSVSNQSKHPVATKLFQPTPAVPPQEPKSTPVVPNVGFGPTITTPEVSSFGFPPSKSEAQQGMFSLPTSQPSAFAAPKSTQQRQAPVQPQPINVKPAQAQSQPVSVKPTQAPQQIQPQEAKAEINNTGTEKHSQYKAVISARAAEDISTHLIQEANEFQDELYDQLQKWRNLKITIGSDEEIRTINSTLHNWEPSDLRAKCDGQELKDSVNEMKADLVRACAVLAEASSRPSAHELEQVNRLDPVLAARRASLQRLQYYVNTQLQQAGRELDQRWQAFQDRLKAGSKSGKGDSIRLPAMDNVYQPLVRQQEILSKQKSTLAEYRRILKNSGFDIDNKSKLLSAKAFDHNANDTLSKLSKNMLNMSLDTSNAAVARYNALNQQHMKISPSKINNLRNLLTAHQTVKIKPVRIEIPDKSNVYISRTKQLVPTEISTDVMKNNRDIGHLVPKIVPIAEKVVQSERPKASPFAPISSGKDLSQQRPATFKNAASLGDYFDTSASSPHTSLPAATSTPAVSVPTPNLAPPALFPTPTPVPSASLAAFSVPNSSNVTASGIFMGQKICSPTNMASGSNISPFALSTSSKSSAPTSSTTLFGPTTSTATGNLFGAKSEIGTVKPTTFVSKPTLINNIPSSIDSAKPAPSTSVTAFSTQPSLKTPDDKSSEIGGLQVSAKETNADKQKSVPFSSLSISLKPTVDFDVIKDQENNVAKSLSASTSSSATSSIFSTVAKPVTREVTKSIETLEKLSPVVTTPTSTFSFTQKFSESQKLGSASTTVPASSLFSAVTSKPETTTVIAASSLFASANKNSEPVSESSTDAKPADSKTQNSIFASSVNITTDSKSSSSLFGGSAVSKPSDSKPETGNGLFSAGQPTDNKVQDTKEQPTLFGSKTESKTDSKLPTSLFGSSTERKPAEKSIFGTSNQVETQPSSFFSDQSKSLTDVVAAPSTTAFAAGSQVASPASIFAVANAAVSSFSGSSVFGGSAGNTTTTTPSVFGSPSAVSPSSVFGSPTSGFGAPATATNSIFGSAPTNSNSVFGAPVPASTTSVFGTAGPTTTAPSIFGSSGSQSVFGAAATSMFGSSSAGEVTNIFGSTSIGAGGGGGGGFGSSPSSTGSVFGSGVTFGHAQSGGSIFGSTASTPSTGFGSFSKPSSGTSIFGSSPSTGGFGGAFSAPAAQPGPFSGGTSTTGQPTSAFGAAPAFGSSPVFGSKSAFGQPASFGSPSVGAFGGGGGGGTFGAAPAFGSPPSFGATPAFGATPSFSSASPVKFGSSSPGFGAPTQQSSTFENLAGQNTIGFGNLAQHTPSPPAPTSTFNKSPSFSSWR